MSKGSNPVSLSVISSILPSFSSGKDKSTNASLNFATTHFFAKLGEIDVAISSGVVFSANSLTDASGKTILIIFLYLLCKIKALEILFLAFSKDEKTNGFSVLLLRGTTLVQNQL